MRISLWSKVRQALGRMFGFTLDAFSKIETVASLGLEMRMLRDYQLYALDYFRCGKLWEGLARFLCTPLSCDAFARHTFYMNVSLHFNRAFTTSLSAALLAALMWFDEPGQLLL